MHVFDAAGTYTRSTSLTKAELEGSLAARYGSAYEACVLPSGTAAIAAVALALGGTNPATVHLADEVYCDTPRVFRSLGWRVSRFDAATGLDARAKTSRPNLVFVEACANPTGRVTAFDRLRHAHNSLVVDNTWSPPPIFNPFQHGALCVVESLTKYASGGTHIAGAVIGKGAVLAKVRRWQRNLGLHVPDPQCRGILERLPSADERLLASATKTRELIQRLRGRVDVLHPMATPEDPRAALLGLPPPILVVRAPTRMDRAQITAWAGGIPWETSYGSAHSKLCNFVRPRNGTVDLRLSIGYGPEDVDELARRLLDLVAWCAPAAAQ